MKTAYKSIIAVVLAGLVMLLGATSVAIAQEEVWEINFNVQEDLYSPYSFFVRGNFLIKVSDGKIISESVPISAVYGGDLPYFSGSGWVVNRDYSYWGKEGSDVLLALNHPISVGDYIGFYGSRIGTETASGDFIIFAYHIYDPVVGFLVHRMGSGSWVGRRIIGENQPPVASLTYSPEKPMIGQEITFDASSSFDPDGDPITYKWDFDAGNGISIDSTELSPKHNYLASGTYVVTLIVNDGKVDSLPATAEITIRGKEFMITFDDGPLPGKTDNILDQLMNIKVDSERVKAGFFMVGNSSLPYYAPFDFERPKGSVTEYPDVANRVAGLGHLIGNHTQHHAWFPQWWAFGFNSMKDFVKDEISQCNNEIEKVISNPQKIFRPPYLYDDPGVSEGAKEKGYKIIWGGIADIPFSNNVKKVQLKAKALLESWKKDEPRVLIFHDNRPVTYNYIREIISYLQDEGFTLVHFDPNRIGEEQKTRQALSGQAHSPVDLNIIDPDGFILNKHVNQIQGSLYEEIDINKDGNLEDFFVVPEPKIGNYQIQVIPEVGASSGDVYSLDVEDGQKLITLVNNTPISEIPEQPYLVQITDGGIQIIPATVRIEPETLNLASKGIFTAFITLPEGYDVANIDLSTVICEGVPAVGGMISEENGSTYIAKFNRQDLVNVPTGDAVTLRVTGKVLHHSGLVDFEGSDIVRVKKK